MAIFLVKYIPKNITNSYLGTQNWPNFEFKLHVSLYLLVSLNWSMEFLSQMNQHIS